jgi:hypothetical protein
MRMSAFLLGGIVGAAMAMYVSRNKSAMLAGVNWDKAIDKLGDMLRSIRSMPVTVNAVQTTDGGRKAGNETGVTNGLSGDAEREAIEMLFSEDL